MTSPVITTLNDAGKWEVRANNAHETLLGTFDDTFCRDLFVEAVLGIVLKGDNPLRALEAASPTRTVRPAA